MPSSQGETEYWNLFESDVRPIKTGFMRLTNPLLSQERSEKAKGHRIFRDTLIRDSHELTGFWLSAVDGAR